MTKICFFSSAHPELDKRVFQKEAVWLAEAGHDVTHLCPGETAGEKVVDGVRIETYTRRGGLLGRALNAPKLFNLGRKQKADALHANELDSWLIGLVLKLFTRTKVVFDVHEFYPSMFAETRMPKPLAPVAEGFIRLLYRVLAPATDLVVLANRYIRKDFSPRLKNVVTVENFAPLETARAIDALGAEAAKQKPAEGPLKVIHVGLMAKERGSHAIPDAIELLDPDVAQVRMIGKMADTTNDAYREMLTQRGLTGRVDVVDWLLYEDLMKELVASDIGVVFFQSGSETNSYGLPHKLFDYLAASIPVLVSVHAKYVAEIVTEADCGVILDSEDPAEIARVLRELAGDRDRLRQLGQNGRAALETKFNWNSEIAKLTEYYGAIK